MIKSNQRIFAQRNSGIDPSDTEQMGQVMRGLIADGILDKNGIVN